MSVAERFYEAFALGDWHTMGLLYAPHARFSDPIFRDLDAAQAAAMWQMLLSRAPDFAVGYNITPTGPERARIVWVADYTFPSTGRRVRNRVVTEMQFAANRIVQQVDRFSFWRWARQALGPTGALLGWSPLLRARIRREAMGSLQRFIARERERSAAGTVARPRSAPHRGSPS